MNDGIVTDFLFSESPNWETVREVDLIHNPQNIARRTLPRSSFPKIITVNLVTYVPDVIRRRFRYKAALSACHDSLLTLCQYALASDIKGANVHACRQHRILLFPFSRNKVQEYAKTWRKQRWKVQIGSK